MNAQVNNTLVIEDLVAIQHELKAPKDKFNSFGKYNYRSCESILEAVK
ncbi:ERF family protein, partial [Acinetobacter baumannii]